MLAHNRNGYGMTDTVYSDFDSPVGTLGIARRGGAITSLRFASNGGQPSPLGTGWVRDDHAFDDLREQLACYFAGRLESFDLELAPEGTAFQQRVWSALRNIPFGQTLSYGALAGQLGRPGAARAVGTANGANPIAVLIPCHRVIAADGSLAGFAGGVEIKRRLLDLERKHAGLFASQGPDRAPLPSAE